jgi:hypothetical protein
MSYCLCLRESAVNAARDTERITWHLKVLGVLELLNGDARDVKRATHAFIGAKLVKIVAQIRRCFTKAEEDREEV